MPVVVLVHGAWLGDESWDAYAERLRARGYEVVAPPWPEEGGDRKLQRKVGLDEIVESYETVVQGLSEPPILIGHSFGGLVVERMMDDGYGRIGVVYDPAPAKGILPTPRALMTGTPVLLGFGGVEEISERSFRHTFANEMPREQAAAMWTEYAIPTPARPFFQVAFAPFGHATKVHFKNDARAPLLIVAAEHDRTVSPSMIKAAYRRYERKSDAVTEFREYEGKSHFLLAEDGWEQICDDTMAWVESKLGGP